MYLALVAQRNRYAVYTTGVYMDQDGERGGRKSFLEAGKTLDMRRSCIRFWRLQDPPPEVIGLRLFLFRRSFPRGAGACGERPTA